MWIVIVIVVAVTLVAVAYWWLSQSASKINDYFCNAVTVYALGGEEIARLAALTAAAVAADKQRASMVTYLRGMEASIVTHPEGDLIGARLVKLAEQITQMDFALETVRLYKQELGARSPELHAALDNPDPSVFVRKWPGLF